jgi:hypothetical protein
MDGRQRGVARTGPRRPTTLVTQAPPTQPRRRWRTGRRRRIVTPTDPGAGAAPPPQPFRLVATTQPPATPLPCGAPQHYWIVIASGRGLATAVRGNVTISTPSLTSARMAFSSTSSGSAKLRSNVP